jgi:hypothetical protein
MCDKGCACGLVGEVRDTDVDWQLQTHRPGLQHVQELGEGRKCAGLVLGLFTDSCERDEKYAGVHKGLQTGYTECVLPPHTQAQFAEVR